MNGLFVLPNAFLRFAAMAPSLFLCLLLLTIYGLNSRAMPYEGQSLPSRTQSTSILENPAHSSSSSPRPQGRRDSEEIYRLPIEPLHRMRSPHRSVSDPGARFPRLRQHSSVSITAHADELQPPRGPFSDPHVPFLGPQQRRIARGAAHSRIGRLDDSIRTAAAPITRHFGPRPKGRLHDTQTSLRAHGDHFGIVKQLDLLDSEMMKAPNQKRLQELLQQKVRSLAEIGKAQCALNDARRLGHVPHAGLEERLRMAKAMHEFVHERFLEHGVSCDLDLS